MEMVKNLGVDQVIDYKKQDFSQVLQDLDVVFDTVGGETREKSFGVLKEGGILVSIINPPDEEKARQHHVRTGYFFVESSGKKLSTLAHLITTGKLKPVVGKVFSFTEHEVREAQQLSQSGHAVGKIVIKIREEG
jgi:NADPH:quinone reductase-like Zn-dependent oxidoreductase